MRLNLTAVRPRAWTRLALAGAIAASAVSLAACGSSGSSGGSTSSATAGSNTAASATHASVANTTSSGSKATGSPVDLWALAPLSSSVGNVPGAPAGVRIAARYLNGHGGLGRAHHAVVVRTCDTQGTPQGEVQCAQQAVADKKAVAAVNPIELYNPNALTATLQKGGLAAVNPYISTTQQLTNPINFPIVAAYFAGAACSTLTAKATGDKRVGYAQINLPTSEQGDAYAAGVARKAGLTVAGTVTIPVTTTDLSTYIQQLLNDNPQIVVLNMQPGLVAQFVQAAAQLGANWTYCAQDGITEWQQLVGLGSRADSFYFAAMVPQVTQPGSAIVNTFRSQAQAEYAAGDKAASLDPSQEPGDAFTAWLAMQVVDQVTQHMPGAITRAGFLHKLAHSTVHLRGALPTIDFAKPDPMPQFRRLFNTTLFLDKWNPSTKTEDPVSSVKPEVFGR